MVQGEITPQEVYELICKTELPKVQSYNARDGSQLFFRHFPANSNRVVILLHRIAEDRKYLFRFAEYVSSKNLAQVYTPDLRGC